MPVVYCAWDIDDGQRPLHFTVEVSKDGDFVFALREEDDRDVTNGELDAPSLVDDVDGFGFSCGDGL